MITLVFLFNVKLCYVISILAYIEIAIVYNIGAFLCGNAYLFTWYFPFILFFFGCEGYRRCRIPQLIFFILLSIVAAVILVRIF